MPDTTSYIREDEHSVKRVGKTRVMLDSVVAAFQQGHSAETIAQQYPALTLEEIYGAIAYYLGKTGKGVDRKRGRESFFVRLRCLAFVGGLVDVAWIPDTIASRSVRPKSHCQMDVPGGRSCEEIPTPPSSRDG